MGVEHKVCKGCGWNKYPICNGLIFDGVPMNIENLKPLFICGTKDESIAVEFKPTATEAELKIEELEARLVTVEEKTKDLSELPK